MDKVVKSLLYPFETDGLKIPEKEQRVLVFPSTNETFIPDMNCEYHTYSACVRDSLQNKNLRILPSDFENLEIYDFVLCPVPQQKEEAQFTLAKAVKVLKQKCTLVAAAANDAGGKRLKDWFLDLGLSDIQIESKFKTKIVWAQKIDPNFKTIQNWMDQGCQRRLDLDGQNFVTQPGVFGWDKVDVGSRLLFNHVLDLKGVGADFGCGYGYLSCNILDKYNTVKILYAIDDDWRAVQACAQNVPQAKLLWHDLRTRPVGLAPLDFVIMNPPFHSGKTLDITLGQAMVKTAQACLRKNGILHMVSNNHLPYETILENLFQRVERVTTAQGFKILRAIK